jgi:hypothetical protein
MIRTFAARLGRLESTYERGPCPTCYGHPMREIFEDPHTGDAWHDSMPEDACPACGRPIIGMRVIVISEDAESRAVLLPERKTGW